jgi:hypothetical protein
MMNLASTAFKEGKPIPPKYTKDGPNVNPPLAWDDVPDGTQSFALIVDDPDAPVGTWVHWRVVNIAPDAREIAEDSVPEGARQLQNDFRKEDWGGPAPPSGTHRYFFKLYALDVPELECDKDTINDAIEQHKIAEAVLMGKYSRKK